MAATTVEVFPRNFCIYYEGRVLSGTVWPGPHNSTPTTEYVFWQYFTEGRRFAPACLTFHTQHLYLETYHPLWALYSTIGQDNSVALVRKRTIPTERPRFYTGELDDTIKITTWRERNRHEATILQDFMMMMKMMMKMKMKMKSEDRDFSRKLMNKAETPLGRCLLALFLYSDYLYSVCIFGTNTLFLAVLPH
jgi:hypothetical protein